MHKTIGILAHVDAGKTTFSEQLLYHTESIRTRGRVDHQDTFLDHHAIEKERGITVFAEQALFTYGGSSYTLIDTPGHTDFSPEMERAVQVMDAAILLVSAAEGVKGHTETVWRLLRKHRVPTFFFLNKTDQEGADPERALREIHEQLTEDALDLTAGFDENAIEFIAERDEELLERYLDSGYEPDQWLRTAKRLTAEGRLFICGHGSALKDTGVMPFFEMVDRLTETDYSDQAEFGARVYKIRHDAGGQRVTFLKILSGSLNVREEIGGEKVTQIRLYSGTRYTQTERAEAGQLVAVTGLASLETGDGAGTATDQAAFELMPALTSKVLFDPAIHPKDMLRNFRMLDAEDPSLRVVWNEQVQEIHVRVMGVIQLEVLERTVLDRFGCEVSFGEPTILYKETIAAPVTGYGHFEPLRHYAEVHLRIEPAERNSGISFENTCSADDLTTGHQQLVRQHVFERDHHGLLTGSALTDVKITLLTGRGHNEHTHGGDFREATWRAIRQGLEQAENILLEPVYAFTAKVDQQHTGRILSDIQQAHGTFNAPETHGNMTAVTGIVPVATFMDYPTAFAAYTNGKGSLSLQFTGYAACHNTEEVRARIGYSKDADPLYSSSSIFCARGKGYTVPWNEAKDAMHCL